jgi:hypothetical protein
MSHVMNSTPVQQQGCPVTCAMIEERDGCLVNLGRSMKNRELNAYEHICTSIIWSPGH